MPVSKLCVFTGFEMGRCLYIWWQIKQSAEIGAFVSLYAQYSPLPLLPLKSIYILHSIGIYWCSEKQTEAGKIAKIVDFSAVEKHLADILIPGLVTWTALHQSDDVLTVSRSQSYNAHLLLSITPLHFIASLNKRSGAATSRRDCKAWPCNCLIIIIIVVWGRG